MKNIKQKTLMEVFFPEDKISRVCSEDFEPIHMLFNLTYANYRVLPRSLLQSMPKKWQKRFVRCIEDFDAMIPKDIVLDYTVHKRDSNGRFVHDPFADYERGRSRIKLNMPCEDCNGTGKCVDHAQGGWHVCCSCNGLGVKEDYIKD